MAQILTDSHKLSQLQRTDRLEKDDLIVIEQGEESFKVTYGQLLEMVASKARSKLKSAAFKSADDFAKFAHGHDYTDFYFFASYGSGDESSRIGTFSVKKYLPGSGRSDVKNIPVYQTPVTSLDDIDNDADRFIKSQNTVGDVVLVAFNGCDLSTYLSTCRGIQMSGSNVDIHDESFQGYVIPDGTTFTCQTNEFKDACRVFGSSAAATSFTVPDLHDQFVKFCLDPADISFDEVAGHTAIPIHSHSIQSLTTDDNRIEVDAGKLQMKLSLAYYADKIPFMTMNTEYAHFIPKKEDRGIVYIQLKQANLSGKLNDISIDQTTIQSADESYPDNVSVFPLMYIGAKT